jgi:hypothetical protein
MNVIGKISTALVLVALGGVLVLGAGALVPGLPWSSASSSDSSLVVTAIERTEEVSLLTVGVQGITEARESKEIFGITVPGSERAKFIQHEFNLKLGIDGSQVTIEETGDNEFTLTVPRFIVIGHDELDIDTVVEDNGILSWVSSDISESEETEKVLSADALAEYVVKYDDLLRDQTEFFYSSIIRSIDPTIDLVFVYGT